MDAERKAADDLAAILQNDLLYSSTLIDESVEIISHLNESVTDQEINKFLSKCNDDREKSNKMYYLGDVVNQRYVQK